jgi:p-hydroxybenzoate 3-monooxygenase
LTTRVPVGIVGAGPAGLLLAQLLARRGIASRVLERSSREHVEGRIRAGVLEQSTVDTLHAAGVGARLAREGMTHHGIELRFGRSALRIDFADLVPGRSVTVYGQREVVRDLIAARLGDPSAAPDHLLFDAAEVAVSGIAEGKPRLHFSRAGKPESFDCDWIVGCDGSHGISRQWFPSGALSMFEQAFPFAWLGVLAHAAPSTSELIYVRHERGFALHSMRTPEISRFYLQVPPDEVLSAWSDERIWAELGARLETVPGWHLRRGSILEKGLAGMRSVVVAPLRHGCLFLCGDAAHIVPATGAKGLNLAVADVQLLSEAFAAWYERGDGTLLDAYSDACLRRVWRVQRFSAWLTRLLHVFPEQNAFDRQLQLAELEYLAASRAARTTLAENYVGFSSSETEPAG